MPGTQMQTWERLFSEKDWNALEDHWRELYAEGAQDEGTLGTLRAILARLEAEVPRVDLENGTEMLLDRVSVEDMSEDWKGAAQILVLGELKAAVEGDPPIASIEWQGLRALVVKTLENLVRSSEVTEGNEGLSRRAHAERALQHLKAIDLELDWALGEAAEVGNVEPGVDTVADDQGAASDREWLRENVLSMVRLAFLAGSEARSAIGKERESHTLIGAKMVRSAAMGRQQHARKRKKTSRPYSRKWTALLLRALVRRRLQKRSSRRRMTWNSKSSRNLSSNATTGTRKSALSENRPGTCWACPVPVVARCSLSKAVERKCHIFSST